LSATASLHGLCVNRKRQKKLIKAAKGKATLPAKGSDLPVNGVYPFTCLGVTSEAFGDALGDYVRANPDSSLKGKFASQSSALSPIMTPYDEPFDRTRSVSVCVTDESNRRCRPIMPYLLCVFITQVSYTRSSLSVFISQVSYTRSSLSVFT